MDYLLQVTNQQLPLKIGFLHFCNYINIISINALLKENILCIVDTSSCLKLKWNFQPRPLTLSSNVLFHDCHGVDERASTLYHDGTIVTLLTNQKSLKTKLVQ